MEQLSLDVPEEKSSAFIYGASKKTTALEPQQSSVNVSKQPEGIAESSLAAGKCYFPCNREDALLLLGGGFISLHFPDLHVLLPVDDNGLFLMESSLRTSEEILISAGREENFPLLLEISSSILQRASVSIGFGDIECLVFRNDSEADAFRFRPVDEFDPEALPFRIAPLLFGGSGEPRFRVQRNARLTRLGHLVDRIPAGVHFLMTLAQERPECRSAVRSIFSSPAETSFVHAGYSISQAVMYGLTPWPSDCSLTNELLTAFIEFDGYGASQLLEQLKARLVKNNKDTANSSIVDKWLQFATDVIHSRVALSGEHLSDERAIDLRAALLALIPESVDSIEVFLEGEKPAGTVVAANAAFLVGLKSGLSRMPWQTKKGQAAQLGELARILFEALESKNPKAFESFLISIFEQDKTAQELNVVTERGIVVLDTSTPFTTDEIDEFWDSEFLRTGFEVVGQGRSRYSWIVKVDEALFVEVQHSVIHDWYYPILRYVFTDDVKLKKNKDIHNYFIGRGHFWYFGESSGQFELTCDLPELPCGNARNLLVVQLKNAIGYCVVPNKIKKPRVSRKNKTTES